MTLPVEVRGSATTRPSGSVISAPIREARSSEGRRSVVGTMEAIQRALEVLLSPTEYADWRSWRREVHRRLLDLTGAERMAIYTPLVGEGSDTDGWCVPGMTGEWKERPCPGSLVVQRPSMPITRAEIAAVEVDFGGRKPAVLYFTDGQRPWWRPDAERVASLRAVLPALRAGLATWRRAAEQRAELPVLLEALAEAALVFDRGGTLLHANEGARTLLAGQEGQRIRGEAQQLAWTVDAAVRRARASATSATLPAIRTLRIDATSYRLRGLLPPESMRGPEGAILVTIERHQQAPLTDDELRTQFGLTAREVEVVRLVAQGLSNQEIADKLGVSFFTARNHVERLLVKLGVGNRARVGVVLSGAS